MLNKTKIKKQLTKVIFGLAVLGLVVFPLIFILIKSVRAIPVEDMTAAALLEEANIQMYEYTLEEKKELGFEGTQTKITLWKKIWDQAKEKLRIAGAVAFKSALRYFLNTLAYDTATWLASGGEGQQPMFETKGWGEYLKDVGDQAAGKFIEELGQTSQCKWISGSESVPAFWQEHGDNACEERGLTKSSSTDNCVCSGSSTLKLNLCQPNLNVQMRIGLGLERQEKPGAPTCTWSQMKENWEEELNDPNFLNKFQASLNPWENDVGIAWSLQTGLLARKEEAKSEEQLNRLDEQAAGGFKAIWNAISGTKKSPEGITQNWAQNMVDKATSADEKYTDSAVADAISTFTNTLIGKLSQRLLKEGLALLHGDSGEEYEYTSQFGGGYGSGSGLYSYEGEAGYSGVAAAQMRFADFLEAGFVTGGPYEVLQQLVMCSDPNNPGPTECVIDERFRHAIENKTQVGNLDPDIMQRPFGVSSRRSDTGEVLEPSYKEGFPLRSLIILRKYRIIPVGWELAAQYISHFDDKIHNLGELVRLSKDPTSVFSGLIEPDWVLKAPENYCRRQGPGPVVSSIDITGGNDQNQDGDYEEAEDVPPLIDLYRDDYCADEQSCIVENDDGSCRFYGYCTEEKRVWNFGADNCQKNFNTCQTFASRTGATASYLKNSLAYNGCNVDNVGCWWFCQDYDAVANAWACASPGKSYKKCLTPGGCTIERQCDIPLNGNQCNAEQDGTLLVSAIACNRSWIKSNNKEVCELVVWGQIPYGATQVTVPACSTAENLLKNGGFEDGTGYDASNWDEESNKTTNKQQNNNAYQRRIKKSEARAGSYVLESYVADATTQLITTASPIVVGVGEYIISGWVYNNLNGGQPFLKIVMGNLSPSLDCSGLPANGSKQWSQFFCRVFISQNELNLTANAGLKVQLIVQNKGNNKLNGTLWFDDVKLQENCLGQAVTIYNGNKPQDYTDPNDNNDIYFDAQAETCPATANGCSELIRTKAGLGANLSANSSFSEFDGTAGDGVADKVAGWNIFPEVDLFISNESMFGQTAVKVTATSNPTAGLTQDINLGTSPTGRVFTLSFWAKLPAGGSSQELRFYMQEDWQGEPADDGNDCDSDHHFAEGAIGDAVKIVTGEWQRFSTTAVIKDPGNPGYRYCSDNMMRINIFADAEVLIDGVQLEELSQGQIENGENLTDYKDYGSINQVYLKKPPEYYGCRGYTASRPPNSSVGGGIDPASCSQFAQVCFEDEISCQWYTPLNGDPKVPGVAKYPDDFCPAECAGYQAYKQEPTFFERQGEFPLYFIPQTAKKCSAQQAGCDEFTNLDEVAKGGEGREYYTEIRQCQKPGGDCNTYYTWIGSDVNGYQLQVYQLKKSNVGGAPCAYVEYNEQGQPICLDNKDKSGQCAPDEVLTNPDCREFYDTNGNISYQRFSRTITCSDDCHPYRKTVADENNCDSSGGWWNSNNECIYYAIPNQGIKCSASSAGCRAYTGNAGKNIMNVLFDAFEDGTDQNWGKYPYSAKAETSNSNESISVGGHSLKITTNTRKDLNNSVNFNRGYLLEFWAKDGEKDGDVLITPVLAPLYADWNLAPLKSPPLNYEFGEVKLTDQWRYYQVGPVFTDWQFANEGDIDKAKPYLAFFSENKSYYLDNIVLKEVTDSIFAIRDSWQTPIACDNNYFDANGFVCGGTASAPKRCTGPESESESVPAMLGCESYRDSNNQTLYLKSFDHLCREEAVGCEAFIDTYNSTPPFEKIYQPGDASAVTVPADRTILLVNDPKKTCDAENKGCLGLGRPTMDQNDKVASYQTVYLKNNPDKYDSIMCLALEVGCEEYTSGNSSAYFKDPGVKVCDYKAVGNISQKQWYKRGTTELCPMATSQLGIEYPTNNPAGDGWAGICPANQSGCSEFIDPISPYAKNLIFNGNFEQRTGNKPDGWDKISSINNLPGGAVAGSQSNILFEPNTLYTLSFSAEQIKPGSKAIVILQNCSTASAGVNSPDGSMIIERDKKNNGLYALSLMARASDDLKSYEYSGRFYSASLESCEKLVFGSEPTGSDYWFDDISLRKTGVYYKINDSKINRTACNGQVDFNKGCVLFNDRGAINWQQGEGNNKYLVFDADQSPAVNGAPKAKCDNNLNDNYSEACDSNALLKVTPDRVCDEWLYCQSSMATINQQGEKENMCFDIGLCNSIDEQGKCDNMPLVKPNGNGNQTYREGTVSQLKNLSGFSKVGFDWGNNEKIDGFYPIDQMSQAGNLAKVINGDFESASIVTRPSGWDQEEDIYETKQVNELLGWSNDYFKIVDDPIEARDEGVCYKSINPCLAPEGRNFLKVNSVYRATSDFVNVYPGTEYVISAYINSRALSEGTAGILILEYGKQIEMPDLTSPPTYSQTTSSGKIIGVGQVSLSEESGYCINSTLDSIIKGYQKDEILKNARCETNYDCDAGMICQTWDNIIPFLPSFTEAGQDWSFKISKFTTSDTTTRVKLKLLNYAEGTEKDTGKLINQAAGSSYFDDVQIRPALQTQDILDENAPAPECWLDNIYDNPVGCGKCDDPDGDGIGICENNGKECKVLGYGKCDDPDGDGKGKCSNYPDRDCKVPPVWQTTSSCRLYPATDSMSCAYTDEQGAKNKGWRGYCLEYDRAPGKTDTCLLWWPVDIIRGESWGPEFGYNNRYPLYYCLAAEKSSPDGKCADNTISTQFARYPHLCPTKGAHDCASCALGENGYTVVEFEDGITDKGNQTEWGKDPLEPSRYDLSVTLGTRSGWDGIEVSVSNNPNGPWIPLGKAYGGYEFSMYQQYAGSNCNGDKTCMKTTGQTPSNMIRINKDGRACQLGGNCCKDGKECQANRWYTQWSEELWKLWGKEEKFRIFYPVNTNEFNPSKSQSDGNSLDRCMCTSVSEWTPLKDVYQEYVSNLTYKFDFFGTDAEGGTFRYVKVDTIKAGYEDSTRKGRWDISSGSEIITIKALNSSPACLWISQVVTSESNQKAWLSRVNQGNNYTARNKNGADNWNADDYLVATHFYSDDWPPFGGIIPPEPVDNPTLWDSRKDIYYNYPLYSEAPDTVGYQSPYQARAGRPYSIERPGDIPSNQGIISGGSITQLIPAGGVYVLKRLFAESYGTWQWGGTIGRCVGGSKTIGMPPIGQGETGEECEVDDCPDGSCLSSSRCTLQDARCEVDNQCAGNGICIAVQLIGGAAKEAKCTGGSDDGKLCCPREWGVCGYKQSDSGIYAGFCNFSRTSCQTECDKADYCDEATKTCISGSKETLGKSCCPPVSTGFGFPGSQGEKPDRCVGLAILQCDGKDEGKTCVQDDCPSGTCNFAERRYYVSSKYLWGPPKIICPPVNGKYERPLYDASKKDDYCGIPPQVGNVKVNGKKNLDESVVLIEGGFATLTFTSHVDKDQLPITGYKLDWGDGNVTSASGISINQNPSASNPHTFYHYYGYWDIKSAADSDCKICEDFESEDSLGTDWCKNNGLTGVNICKISPRVQITDNWGWCTNTKVDEKSKQGPCVENKDSGDGYERFKGQIYVAEK
ncbi:MAG: hypothetical protein V1684_00350 [bacterium]